MDYTKSPAMLQRSATEILRGAVILVILILGAFLEICLQV